MKKQINFRQNKGITGADLSIAVVAIIIFVSIITTLFYNVYMMNQKTARNVQATELISSIFEKIETLSYEETTIAEQSTLLQKLQELNITITSNDSTTQNLVGKKGGYIITLNIKKYNELEENTDKNLEDIIKIINVKIEYKIGENIENVEMSTLKIKE